MHLVNLIGLSCAEILFQDGFFFIGQQNYLTDVYACSFVWCFLFKCYIHLSKKHSSKNHTPLILIQSSVSLENLPQSMSFYQLRIFTHLFSYFKKNLFGKFLSQSIKDNLTLDLAPLSLTLRSPSSR